MVALVSSRGSTELSCDRGVTRASRQKQEQGGGGKQERSWTLRAGEGALNMERILATSGSRQCQVKPQAGVSPSSHTREEAPTAP